MADLWLLFSTGFLSATLLPGGSEANLLWLIHQNQWSLFLLVFIATLGNTLGGMTNYYLGRFLPKREAVKPTTARAMQWLNRHGHPILLLSWLPVIGDPLCLVAGWLRLNQIQCWIYIALGKGLRYTFLAIMAREILF